MLMEVADNPKLKTFVLFNFINQNHCTKNLSNQNIKIIILKFIDQNHYTKIY